MKTVAGWVLCNSRSQELLQMIAFHNKISG